MVRDLDLDGVKVTPASRTTEIWPFEYLEITTLDEV